MGEFQEASTEVQELKGAKDGGEEESEKNRLVPYRGDYEKHEAGGDQHYGDDCET